MAEKSVNQIENELKSIEDEYSQKVNAINKRIADFKASGFRQYKGDEEDQLLEQLATIKRTHETFVVRVQARLQDAKIREKADLQAQEEKQTKQAASMKERALREWAKAGGTLAEFEQAYPAIRTQILQAEAIRNMARKPVTSDIHL